VEGKGGRRREEPGLDFLPIGVSSTLAVVVGFGLWMATQPS
jgi:hypothetical protein